MPIEYKLPSRIEEFEHDLIGVLQKHYGENFDYNWDSEEDGFYFRLRVWKGKEDSN